jgi:ssDNA-binding Zn-finger/Zn-ribbon topoisomerase 1
MRTTLKYEIDVNTMLPKEPKVVSLHEDHDQNSKKVEGMLCKICGKQDVYVGGRNSYYSWLFCGETEEIIN